MFISGMAAHHTGVMREHLLHIRKPCTPDGLAHNGHTMRREVPTSLAAYEGQV